jgi:type I restriction enzyme, S subunit
MSEVNTEKYLEKRKLSDIASIKPGVNVPAEMMGFGIPYVTVKDVYENRFVVTETLSKANIDERYFGSHQLFDRDILLAKSSVKREGIGYGCLMDNPSDVVIPSGFTVRIRSNHEICDPEFLFYQLRSDKVRRWILNNAQASALTNLNSDIVNSIPIDLLPLPEQKKIASILTSVDEVIEKTQSQIDKLQDLKKGTMNELLTKGIGHTEFKDSELGRIPKSWEVSTGEALLDPNERYPMRSGPFGSALLKNELVSEGIPFLGIDNVHREFFKTDYHRFISEPKFNELKRYQVFPDDVMVTIMGTVGRCCLVPKGIEKAISSKHTWVMTFDKMKVLPDLICWQINYSNWVLKHFADNSQGGVMDAISSETLRKTKFSVPPIGEQQQISQAYQEIRNTTNLLEGRLEKTQSLKKSLMQDLLTGKVRVSVN